MKIDIEKIDKEIVELEIKILQIEKEELIQRLNFLRNLSKSLKELDEIKNPQLLQE